MKVYKVECHSYGCSFFDIVCANSEEEALEVSFERTDNEYLEISDLKAEELDSLSSNSKEACVITGTFIN